MTLLVTMLVVLLAGASAQAEALQGAWFSPPDARGQTGIVLMHPCGQVYCGTLQEAFNASGEPITTPNVGRRLLRDVQPVGDGTYAARAFVPLLGREFAARLELSGNQLRVSGCSVGGAMCREQVWNRGQ